jgi:8-oxo-dGTP diphosphatase
MVDPQESFPGGAICALEVQVVVFSLRDQRLQVLLESAGPDLGDRWTLPGSPVTASRSLEESANACLARFICRHRTYLEQLYTYGDPARHPTRRVISVVYFALIPSDAFCAPAEPVQWFPVDDLPALALDSADILAYAVRRLRYKLEYSAAGFELLPEFFTLSELQRTYEMILGERLDKRNFRRRILQAGIIETTTQRRAGEGRPAQLYRYRPDAVAEVKVRRLFP